MMAKYKDLDELLDENDECRQFFSSLPDYVRETIQERGDNVCTESALHRYADNLLRGDG